MFPEGGCTEMPTVQYEGGQWKVTEERLWLVSWEKGVHDGQIC